MVDIKYKNIIQREMVCTYQKKNNIEEDISDTLQRLITKDWDMNILKVHKGATHCLLQNYIRQEMVSKITCMEINQTDVKLTGSLEQQKAVISNKLVP